MLDDAAILLVLAPKRDDVAVFMGFGTRKAAIGERLFENLPRLDVVGHLPRLDLLGEHGQFVPEVLAGVLLDERADLLEELSRVVLPIPQDNSGLSKPVMRCSHRQ